MRQRLGAEIVPVTDLIILQVHVVVPNLKVDANQIDQRDVVAEMDLENIVQKRSRSGEHVCVLVRTRHHELDSYAKQAASFCQIM